MQKASHSDQSPPTYNKVSLANTKPQVFISTAFAPLVTLVGYNGKE